MSITPDTKNWTWVLERACPECGFDSSAFPREQVSTLLRENAAGWRKALAEAAAGGEPGAEAADVRQRPKPDVWSPLEYACHVRDVFRIYDERLRLMLTEDDPLYANWDQDQTAIDDRYGEQDPARVSVELSEAAEVLAARFEQVGELDWKRPGRRSDGSVFTVESFARYFIHDPVHHYCDVTGVRAA